MRTTRSYLTLSICLMLIAGSACSASFSTANMSSLKLGKDKEASQETSSFGPEDKIYAVAVISNSMSDVKVKGHLSVEDIPGQKNGPIPNTEIVVDLPTSGNATFTWTPPPAGWPKGKYKVEAVMLNENGEQKDQKSATLTVS